MRFCDLQNRRVAVWGVGREGVAVIAALRKSGYSKALMIFNDTPVAAAALPDNAVQVNGSEIAARCCEPDIIIASPGVSRYKPELIKAEQAGVVVTTPTALWFGEHPNARCVCITGTKGKSTTSALTAHLLRYFGQQTILAGNIGVPLFRADASEDAIWIIELSSYQTCRLRISPTIGVLLNLYPEHADWHGSTSQYYQDKLDLFRGFHGDSITLINGSDPGISATSFKWHNGVSFNTAESIHSEHRAIFQGADTLFAQADRPLATVKNPLAACAALSIVQTLGFDPKAALPALQSFTALPHRLHELGVLEGVLYIDDSISTVPEAARLALDAYASQPVTILLGGFDRGQCWEKLAHYLATKPVHAVITMPTNGERIFKAVESACVGSNNSPILIQSSGLEDAVRQAQKVTPPGGAILLSPAAPSYGQFKNFEERGTVFKRLSGFPEEQ